MVAEVVEADRLRVLDEQPQDPAAARQVADQVSASCSSIPVVTKSTSVSPVGGDDAQGAVPGTGQLGRRLDDPAQDGVQVEVGRDRHDRFEERLGCSGEGRLRLVRHRTIVLHRRRQQAHAFG